MPATLQFLVDESTGIALKRDLRGIGHDMLGVAEAMPQADDLNTLALRYSLSSLGFFALSSKLFTLGAMRIAPSAKGVDPISNTLPSTPYTLFLRLTPDT